MEVLLPDLFNKRGFELPRVNSPERALNVITISRCEVSCFTPKDYSMADFFSSIDTAIMGRQTYDKSREMGGGSYDPSLKTYVFSRTPPPGAREGLAFVSRDLNSFVRELCKHSGKDIWLMEGGELARDFLQEDLVDESYLGIVPVLLGEGIRFFLLGFLNAISHSSKTRRSRGD